MSISKDTIVDALRVRYDSYSAETVFEMACQRADLQGKTTFENRELAAFRTALEKVGDRVGGVLARIDEMLGGKPVEAKASAAPAEVKDSKSGGAAPAEVKDSKSGGAAPAEVKDAKSDKAAPPDVKDAKSDKSAAPAEAKDSKSGSSKPNEAKAEAKPEAKP